ncbi:MAG: hypothetical protein KDA92_24445 [Planctomycetales bacterium]|nr:hypothetical protein [Planctomycetales bacterium]
MVRPGLAQLVYDDGGSHTLTGDSDSVTVQILNGSSLTLDGSFRESFFTLEDTAEITVNAVVANSFELNNIPIVAKGNSFVTINDGSELNGSRSSGIELQDASQLLLGGGMVRGDAGRAGIVAGGASTATMTDGEVRADLGDAFSSGPAVLLRDHATFVVSAGKLMSLDLGVVTYDDSRFEANGGIIDVHDLTPTAGIQSFHQSRVVLNDLTMSVESPQTSIPMFDANEESTIVVNHGAFTYLGFGAKTSLNSAMRTQGDASLEINGGAFQIQNFVDPPTRNATPFNVFAASETSDLVVSGGTYDIRLDITDAQDLSLPPKLFLAQDDGTIEIRGGLFAVEVKDARVSAPAGSVRELEAQSASVITLYGSNFNYPLGPIADLEGTLTGQLLDGSAISWSFLRAPTANIILVPEPSTFALSLVSALLLISVHRGRRRSFKA